MRATRCPTAARSSSRRARTPSDRKTAMAWSGVTMSASRSATPAPAWTRKPCGAQWSRSSPPRSPAKAPVAAGRAETAAMEFLAPRVSLRVLAVDDDALVLTNTAAMLEDLGHQCVHCTSATQALDMLQQGTFVDLVITDQVMPRMTGVQLAEAIAKEWPELPVIIATGYAELEPGTGADLKKLPKPFTQAELAAAMAGLRIKGQGGGQVIRLRGNGRDYARDKRPGSTAGPIVSADR